jgi:hypothetical protein
MCHNSIHSNFYNLASIDESISRRKISLILDNCCIHHNEVLVDLVESAGTFFLLVQSAH